jgi:hypothetical protein
MSRLLCVLLLLAAPACLFAQGIEVVKEVDPPAAPWGYQVVYTITVTNPNDFVLYLDYVSDTMFGDLTPMFSGELAPGASESIEMPYVLEFDDPDPLYNSVDFAYYDDLGEQYVNDAQAEVDIFHPEFFYTIECPEQPPPGEPVMITVGFGNVGDVTMVVTIFEPPGFPEPITLGIGETLTFLIFADCVGDLACFEVLLSADFPPEYGISYPYDFALEECCPCAGSPVEGSTWGVIKALYR